MTGNIVMDADEYFSTLADTLSRIDRGAIQSMVDSLIECYDGEYSIYICGNGGSGATASHIVCDFNKGISMYHDKKFHMICLNDNIPTMLAISNDCRYEDIFRMQVEGRIKDGDILLALSGSGNSENVIRVAEYFKKNGNRVIGLSGYSGGRLREISDISVHVPIDDMQKSEDAHMILLHLCAQTIAKKLGHPMC